MSTTALKRFTPQKPIGGLLLLTAALLAPQEIHAEISGTLSESQAVELALARKELKQAVQGARDVELGRAESAARWPNPELAYTREETFGSLGTRDDYLTLSQRIDLSGRRALRAEAAEARAEAETTRGQRTEVAVVERVRTRFYAAVFHSLRVDAVKSWDGRIGQALAVVARRERGGYSATYDRLRIERERRVAQAQLAKARAGDERSRHELKALIGKPVASRLDGVLLPAKDAESLSSLQARVAQRPDLRVFDLQLRAAMLEERAASRWWVPELKLELGWKGSDQGAAGRSDGYVLGAALSLPLWDETKGAGRSARGRAQVARAQRNLELGVASSEVEGARAELKRLRKAALAFRAEALTQNQRLVGMAEKGYLAGELGLLELLDAYRVATEDSLTALDLDWAARQSEIRLKRLVGEVGQ